MKDMEDVHRKSAASATWQTVKTARQIGEKKSVQLRVGPGKILKCAFSQKEFDRIAALSGDKNPIYDRIQFAGDQAFTAIGDVLGGKKVNTQKRSILVKKWQA